MKKIVTTHGSTSRGAVPAWIDRRVLLALGLLAVLAVAGHAAAPAWWAARGILSGRPANDYAVANQGQLKNMAKTARDELVAQGFFQATDANALNTLVNGWSASNESAMDYAPASLGQLKAVAKPFYDTLYLDYPWPAASPAANDYAVANIGQLKAVFAFPVAPFDSDSDGLPDGWERKMFGDLDQGAEDDFDEDGLTESQEFALGTSPIAEDSDADGMPDGWEQSYTLNPLDPTDAGPAQGPVERSEEPGLPQAEDYTHDYGDGPIFDENSFVIAMNGYEAAMTEYYSVVQAADHIDPDKDGLSNLREYVAGTHPRVISTDGDLYSDYEELMYGSDPLAAASIPPLRAEFSQAGPSLLKVSTFRGEHAVGGEAVTVLGSPDPLFLSTGPGAVLTPGQITVTTDPVQHFATVYVFAPAGAGGAQSSGVAVGGMLAGTPFSILSNRWRGTLALTQDPELPGPSPQSTPPAEGVLFTAHRERRVSFAGRQLVSPQTEEYGDPSPMGEQWLKPGGGTPPHSDDGFNGDADLRGDNTDPGDPRDGISAPTGAPVPASPDEKWAYRVETGGSRSTRIIGPYGSPTGMTGTYTATNAYHPPDKAESSASGFIHAQAVSKLESVSYFRGDEANGWQGNGPLGVKSYTVTSTFSNSTEHAPTVTWVDEGSGQTMESSATMTPSMPACSRWRCGCRQTRRWKKGILSAPCFCSPKPRGREEPPPMTLSPHSG